jgi:broad-specificity NMP kinase
LAKIIIVTGTPGVGKTVIGKLLAKKTGFTFLSLGDIVRRNKLHKGFDRRAGSYMIIERRELFSRLTMSAQSFIKPVGWLQSFCVWTQCF